MSGLLDRTSYVFTFGSDYPDSNFVGQGDAVYATWMGGNDYRNKTRMYGAYPPFYLKRVHAAFPGARSILHLFSGSLSAARAAEEWEAGALAGVPCGNCGHPGRYHAAVRPDVRNRKLGCTNDAETGWSHCCGCRKWAPEFRPYISRFDAGLHPAARCARPDVCGDAEEPASLQRAQIVVGSAGAAYQPFSLILADPPYDVPDELRYWKEAHGGSEDGFKRLNKALVVRNCADLLCSGGYLVWLDTKIPMWSKKFWRWRGGITVLRSTNHRVRFATLLERW